MSFFVARKKRLFEKWNLCCNRKRCTIRARPLAPGTIIFQRSFTVRECIDRNDRSALRGVSSTFAESLIVTNDLSAVARIAIRGAKGHTRDFIKSPRPQIEDCLLSARCKSYDLKLIARFGPSAMTIDSLSRDKYNSVRILCNIPFDVGDKNEMKNRNAKRTE